MAVMGRMVAGPAPVLRLRPEAPTAVLNPVLV